MRSYNQFCAMARALDVIGDRWTLLIVRELLTQGPCRYTDLQRGLPGIASNMLADRLRDLEASGLIDRREEPPPVAGILITLTDRGRDLSGMVRELIRWGAPLMLAPQGDAAFRMHWFAMPLRALCRDNSPDRPATVVRFGDLRDGCDLIVDAGSVEVYPCSTERRPDATVAAPADLMVEVFTGQTTVTQALTAGMEVDGSTEAVRRIAPRP